MKELISYTSVNKKEKEILTDVSLHPGKVWKMELEARDIKKSEFATMTNMKAPHLSELLHEKRHVSASLGLKFEKPTGIQTEYWMRIQVYYDLLLARNKDA